MNRNGGNFNYNNNGFGYPYQNLNGFMNGHANYRMPMNVVLFVGQKGCLSDEQCSAREPNATCDSGYCVCPVAKPLVHGGKCVSGCPEGFANIAGRTVKRFG
ncbi:unnamed protein product [Heligmosomoides polygyrus]|uniref:EB domain-containing protein n=1 Tax=Heligmosomoides polygyrus TaxID=6339 RepID=A0A183FPN2_HELPZ|nr:unnamed protein product [Heligmosomoides polygyrus]